MDKKYRLGYRTINDRDDNRKKVNIKTMSQDSAFNTKHQFTEKDYEDKTVPDQSITIKELIKRKKDGQPEPVE